jgi:hypothetical protein
VPVLASSGLNRGRVPVLVPDMPWLVLHLLNTCDLSGAVLAALARAKSIAMMSSGSWGRCPVVRVDPLGEWSL